MLVLEIEFLLGVSFAALGPDSPAPDWPPQPDRIFSALVASWAARGRRADERAALEWLERQEPPSVAAAACFVRPAPTVFVPPNDPQTARAGDVSVMPAMRRRQPRRFPAALPQDPVVCLVWENAADAPAEALDALARDTGCIGHSASLTRCRFVAGAALIDEATLRPAGRRIYPGRLEELEAAFTAGRRPSPGAPVRSMRRPPPLPTRPFGTEWLIFEIVAGDDDLTWTDLDVRAAALAAKALRDALMSGFGAAALAVPEWVSGHAPGGAPSRAPHMAVVPMCNVGWPHSDGALLGFALVPPEGRRLLDEADVLAALRHVTRGAERGRILTLTLGRDGALRLRVALETERHSLDPRRYCAPNQDWATVTPIVLERHLRRGTPAERAAEAESLVRLACRNAGLPDPEAIRLAKHASITGAVSAAPSGRSPAWTGWRVPEHVGGRALVHAELRFTDVVAGPVLIGAGRFVGLGLCLPVQRAAAA